MPKIRLSLRSFVEQEIPSGWKEKEFRSSEEYKDFIADLYDQNIEWKSIEFKPEG